jgi:hypothetical protein
MLRKQAVTVSVLVAAAVFCVPTLAQAASALHVGASPAWITGAQVTQLKWTLGGSTTIKWTTADLRGTTEGSTISQVDFTPILEGTTLGGLEATSDQNGCKFRVTSTATALTWTFDIVGCTNPGHYLAITQASCEIRIGEQGPLSSITASNGGSPIADVLTTLNVTGITYTGLSGCPAPLVGTFSNGGLTGTTTLRAYRDEPPNSQEGAQVSLTAT